MKLRITLFHTIMLSMLMACSHLAYSMVPEQPPAKKQEQSSLLFKTLTNFKGLTLGTVSILAFMHGMHTLYEGLKGLIPDHLIARLNIKKDDDDSKPEVYFHRIAGGVTSIYISHLAFNHLRKSWKKLLKEHYLQESLTVAQSQSSNGK